jgi:hypothetical protein
MIEGITKYFKLYAKLPDNYKPWYY